MLQKMVVPPGLGTVQEIYDGGSGRVVVYIQDAHDIPDAQRSIHKLLEFFQNKWGVNTTVFEGVEGKLDPTLLRQFPDAETLRRIVESYLAKGELSGVSAASILNQVDGEFIGVEKQGLYEEGVSAYLRALQKKPALKARIENIKGELVSLKNKFYSEEAKELDNALRAWHHEVSGISKFPVFLFSKRKPDPKLHPALFKFHQVLEAENKQDPERDRQIKIFAERVKGKTLPPQDLRFFNEKYQAYRTEQIGAEEFVRFLRDVAAKQGMEPPSLLKEEKDGASSDLNGKELLNELSELVTEYKKQVFTSAEEKALEETDGQVSRLEKLAQLELAPEEWTKLKEAKNKQVLPGSFSGLDRLLVDIYHALDSEFSDFLYFYETVHQRDEIFLEKINAILRKEQNPVIGLVSGGFHTEGLTEAFKKEGISYVLIAPAIKEIPEESPYLEHMQGKVSWRSYFRPKNGRIRLDEAFTRASIDGLLPTEGISRSGPTLKLWRDRVLQRLAAGRRLHQSFRYTRFLDEAAVQRADPSHLESLKEKWSAKLGQFLSSLIKLEKENGVNKANIAKLLAGMTATPYSNPLRPGISIPEAWVRSEMRNRQQQPTKLPFNLYGIDLERKTKRYSELWKQYQRAKEGDLHAFYHVVQRLHMNLLVAKEKKDASKAQHSLDIFFHYLRELLHVEKLQEELKKDPENYSKILDLLIELYRDEKLMALIGQQGPRDRHRLLSVIFHFDDDKAINFLFEELEMHFMGQGRPVMGGKEAVVHILYVMGENDPSVLLQLKSRIEELFERRKDPSGWEARHLKLPRRRKNFQAVEDRVKDTIDGHLVEYAKVLIEIGSARSGLLMVPLLVRMTARDMPWWLRDQALHQLESRHPYGRILRENYSHPGQPDRFPDDESFALNLIERLKQERNRWNKAAILGALDALALLGVKSAFREGDNQPFLYSALEEILSSSSMSRYRYLMAAVAAPENKNSLLQFFRHENLWARQTASAGLAAISRSMELPELADYQTSLIKQLLAPAEDDEIGRIWALEDLVSLMQKLVLLPGEPAALHRRAAHWIFKKGAPWLPNKVDRLKLVRQLDPEFSKRVFEHGSWAERSAILSAIRTWPGFASPGWKIDKLAMQMRIEKLFALPRSPKTPDAYLYAENVYHQLLQLDAGPVEIRPGSRAALNAKVEAFTELVLDLEDEVTRLFEENPNRPPVEVYERVKRIFVDRATVLSREQMIYFRLALLRMLRDMAAMQFIRDKAWQLGLMEKPDQLEFSNIESTLRAWDEKDGKGRVWFLRGILGLVPASFHFKFFPTSFHATLDDYSYERLNKLHEYGYDFGVEHLTPGESRIVTKIPGTAGVYYGEFSFRHRGEDHVGILSFQNQDLHRNEHPEKWIERHEEAHLRFQRFGMRKLLQQRTHHHFGRIASIVDELEELLIGEGVKDPDLRRSLFGVVSELILSLQDEIRSRFSDGRSFSPLAFQHWFDFYLTRYEEYWIKNFLPRIQNPTIFSQMMNRLRNGEFQSWIFEIVYSLNNVYGRKFRQEFKNPTESIKGDKLLLEKARRWMEVYSVALPLTYTRVLWSAGWKTEAVRAENRRLENMTLRGISPDMLDVVWGSVEVWNPKKKRRNTSLVRPHDAEDAVEAKIENEVNAVQYTWWKLESDFEALGKNVLEAIDAVVKEAIQRIHSDREKGEIVLEKIVEEKERSTSPLPPEAIEIVKGTLIPTLLEREQLLYLDRNVGSLSRDDAENLIVERQKELLMIKIFEKILNLPYGFNTKKESIAYQEKRLASSRRQMFQTFFPQIMDALATKKPVRQVIKLVIEEAQTHAKILEKKVNGKRGQLVSGNPRAQQEFERLQKFYVTALEFIGYLEAVQEEFDSYEYLYEPDDTVEERELKITAEREKHEQALRWTIEKMGEMTPGLRGLADEFGQFIREEVDKGRSLEYAAAKFFYFQHLKSDSREIQDFVPIPTLDFLMRYYDIVRNGHPDVEPQNPIIVWARTIRDESEYNQIMGSFRSRGRIVGIAAPWGEDEFRIPHWFIFAIKEGIVTVAHLNLENEGLEFGDIQTDDFAVLDGKKGLMIVNPPGVVDGDFPSDSEWARRKKFYNYLDAYFLARARLPVPGDMISYLYDETHLGAFQESDGNGSPASKGGGRGVGLLRLEELMREPERLGIELDAERLRLALTEILAYSFFHDGRPMIVRLFDVAPDKRPSFLKQQFDQGIWKEEEFFEHFSGPRFYLSKDGQYRQFREFGKIQLRAIFGAYLYRGITDPGLKILFSDIRDPAEIFALEELVEEAKQEFLESVARDPELAASLRVDAELISEEIDKIPVGYMFEDTRVVEKKRETIFEAIRQARARRPAERFIGIGTNDLMKSIIKYRMNGRGSLTDINPHLLRDLWLLAETAKKYDVRVTVEGNLAGSVDMLMALLVLKIDLELEIIPVASVNRVRELLEYARNVTKADLEAHFAELVLKAVWNENPPQQDELMGAAMALYHVVEKRIMGSNDFNNFVSQLEQRREMRRDEETGLHPEDVLQALQTGSDDDLTAIVLEIREAFKRKAAMGDAALLEKYEVSIARGKISDGHIFRLRARGLPERYFDILLRQIWSGRLDQIFSSQDPLAEFNRFLEGFRYDASEEMIRHFTRSLAFYLHFTSSRRRYMSQKMGSMPWPRSAYPGRRKVLNRYREFLESKGLGTAGLTASLRNVRTEVNELIQLEQGTVEYAGPAPQLEDPAHQERVADIRGLADSGRFEEIMARHGNDTAALEAYIRSLANTQGYRPALAVLQQLTVAGLPAPMTQFGLKAIVTIHFLTLLSEDEEFLYGLAARGALERKVVIEVLKIFNKDQDYISADEKTAMNEFRQRLIKLIVDQGRRQEMRETRQRAEERYKFLAFIAREILEGKDDAYLRELLPDIWPQALRPVRVKKYLNVAWKIAELEAPEETPVIRPSRPVGDLRSPKEFSPEVKTIFEKLEIKTIEGLLYYTAEELLTIGLSKKGLKEVRMALGRFRLKLKNDRAPSALKKPTAAKKKKSAMKGKSRGIQEWPVEKLAEPGKFSQRVLKAFETLKIKKVKDLLTHRPSSLLAVKGFKKQSLKEVIIILKRRGLSLRSENRTEIAVLEDLFGIREAPRSELRVFTQTVRKQGAAAVGEELRDLFDRRIGRFIAQSLLGPPEKLAAAGRQSLQKFEVDARQFLTAHPGSRLEFNFALPYIERPDFKEWLAGLLGKIDALRSSSDHPSRIRVQIRLLAPTAGQDVRAFIASLDLEDEIKRGIEPVIEDSAAARVLNTFLQAHPNALAFSLSPALEKSILHQLQLVHYEEGDLFADTYPLAADILLEAAKLSEKITPEFLTRLRAQFPEEAVRFRRNRLEVRSFARQWILEAAAHRLFATMA